MSLNVTQSNNNLTLNVSQNNIKATLSVTQNINELHITAIQNNEITKLQPIVNTNSSNFIETDPIFQASEASLFVAGDKANLDNQSGINTGDETTLSIQTKRQLKTINGESLEGSGNVQIDYNDLDNLPAIPIPITNHSGLNLDDGTNPHGTNKGDVGLGNVDNTRDIDKPISTATQTALDSKLDKDTAAGVERVWVYGTDGIGFEKPTSELGGKRIHIIEVVIPSATILTSNWLTFAREGVHIYSTAWANENAYDPILDTHGNPRCLKWTMPFKCKIIDAFWEYSTLATPLTINIFTGKLIDNVSLWTNGKTIASKVMPVGSIYRFQKYMGAEIDTTYEIDKYDAVTLAVNNAGVSTGIIRTNVFYMVFEEV